MTKEEILEQSRILFLIWLSLVSFPEVQHTYLPAVPESGPYYQNYQIHASEFLILHTGIAVRNLQAVCLMSAFSLRTAHHRKYPL